jgi:ferredoxin
MTYVITEPCIGEKNGACVDVCPAACIHTTPDAPQNYIDPDVCIECEQCVLVCPVDAVFLDNEVPDEWTRYIEVNAEFFRGHKAQRVLGPDEATRMLAAVQAFAARSGLAVATVILDREGQPLAASQADALPLEQAARKAYTALKYGLATHELRPGPAAPDVDAQRLLFAPGGFPVVEAGDTLGAVGVAGSLTPDQDILCCQAALGALMGHAFA